MENRKQQLEKFFEQYEERFNNALNGASPDIEAVTQSFASCFIEASPHGVNCGKNDESFRNAIPQGYAFYIKIGISSMNILSKEIHMLDDHHAMVKVHWNSNFQKQDNSAGSIEFDVIYFLQTKDNEYRIFAYITGDEQKVLKQIGLI